MGGGKMSSQKLFSMIVTIFATATLLVACGNKDQEIDLYVTASPNGQSGSLSGPTQIQLAASESGAEIYYTIDGSEPNKESTRYQSPIEITGNTALKFIGFYAFETTKKKFGGLVRFHPEIAIPGTSFNGRRLTAQ